MTDLERLSAALADRYRIERELGHGGMAVVYLANDLKHDRQVALKVLRSDISSSLGPERFLREIHTAATLNHPHIMPLLDSGQADGFLYYAMPYIAGESLADRIDREKQLPVDEARQIAREVADGLGYAHAQGVIHRDIKPENIMLSRGHAVIADFGIARAVTAVGGAKLTETGIAIGTAAYMPPEQAAGDGETDHRGDIYSLGCVLYQSLVGQPPFQGDSPRAVLARAAIDPVPPIRTVRRSVPADLENIVGKALDKVPADRFQSAEEFVRALSGDVRVGPTGTFAVPATVGRNRRRWMSAVAGMIIVVVAGSLLIKPPTPPTVPFRLAIFPFDIQSPDAGHGYLTNGLMNRLGVRLDGTGEISVVDQAGTLEAMAGIERSSLSRRQAGDISKNLLAGRFVLPTLLSLGDQFTLTAALYNSVESGPASQQSWDGAENQLPMLVDSMARWIVGQMGAGGEGRLELRQAVSEDWLAEKAYYRGIDHLHFGRYDSAVAVLEEAVRRDSAMADAWFMLMWAYEWQRPNQPGVDAALQEAHAHRDRSSGVTGELIEAAFEHFTGHGNEAIRQSLDILARYPDQAEAWYFLGLARLGYRWKRPHQEESAVEVLQKAHRLHPGNPLFMWNYAWALRNDRQWAAVDSIYREAQAEDRHIFNPQFQTSFSSLVGGTQKSRDSTKAALMSDVRTTLWVLSWLHQGTDSLSLGRDILIPHADNPNWPQPLRSFFYWNMAFADIALGKWQAARDDFAAAASLEPGVIVLNLSPARKSVSAFGYPLFQYASMAVIPFLGASRAELTAVRDSLRAWTPPHVPQVEGGIESSLLPPIRDYLLGLYETRLGDSAAALAHAAGIESMSVNADSIGLLSDLAWEIRALVAAEDGRMEEALRQLERMEHRVASDKPSVIQYPRTFGRLLRADILFQLGRHREALKWYRGFPYIMGLPVFVESSLLSHIYGRMGQIYDELGEREHAIDYYTRFVTRWQDADPQFQPRVDSAKTRLAVLETGN